MLNKINPAANTSFIGAVTASNLYPLLCSESPELSSEIVHVCLLMWRCIFISDSLGFTFGLLLYFFLKVSAIASFKTNEAYLLCVKTSELHVAWVEKVDSNSKILVQSISHSFLYSSFSSCAWKCAIGFNTLSAVLKFKFALYINPLSPLKLTALLRIFIFWAPNSFNSSASISSKPYIVLASM